jgi:riboflavin synthase
MFTGIIETTGTVLSLKTLPSGVQRLTVAAPALAGRWKLGDSIAVNGVCLTAIDLGDDHHPGRFAADLAQETIERTTLTSLTAGSLVNLELPTPSGSPLGGHVVQGHVDGTAVIADIIPLHSDLDHTDWRLRITLPPQLVAYVIPQGSITIDGISLTVAAVHGSEIEIAIIPHTYHATNLHTLLEGSPVNIETDVLSKYALRHTEASTDTPLTVESLIARGY